LGKVQDKKGSRKIHTLLDYDGHLPAYVNITDGKTADNKGAFDIPLLKGRVIVADRFYDDFALLNVWDSNGVNFVVRHKDNIKFTTIKELELLQDKHQHLLKDEIIELMGIKSKKRYPKKLRRVGLWDQEISRSLRSLPIKYLGQQTP
jgi:hypothetical protein